ncbi:unnamed protein product [Symbiodinium natans]|uniref:Uncharacterized protein n=1 Tax=Symbiodinium natans TaxID=878477 RepID=A0A812MP40_9DINO|nr:unnamed protein product [Symbiodinium natans]
MYLESCSSSVAAADKQRAPWSADESRGIPPSPWHEAMVRMNSRPWCLQELASEALDLGTQINLNELYGDPDTLRKKVEAYSSCHVVEHRDMKKPGDEDCQYVMVFEDTTAPINELAANCVPATICKEDVVGMTKGKIATYGVVLQILQQNLGSLVWIGEGTHEECYNRMTEVNEGDLDKVFKIHNIDFLGMHFKEKRMEIDGMKKLDAFKSLGECKDKEDGTPNAYLYIHKNLLWSKDKEAVDIDAFTTYKDTKHMKELEKELFEQAEETLEKAKSEHKGKQKQKTHKARRMSEEVVV